jgi:hypothetical protein
MANFTTYRNGDVIALSGGSNAASLPAVTVFENTYDTSRGAVAQNDVCTEFLKIPAGSYVLGVAIEVLTAEASVTIDVGDSTDPNGYVAAQSMATAGKFAGAGAYIAADTDTTALEQPQFYAQDTWLQFTVSGAALTTGEFRVAAVVANVG